MYAPYHKEMCIWARQVDSIQFCCPIWKEDKKLLVDEIAFSMQPVIALKEFDIKYNSSNDSEPVVIRSMFLRFSTTSVQAVRGVFRIAPRCSEVYYGISKL